MKNIHVTNENQDVLYSSHIMTLGRTNKRRIRLLKKALQAVIQHELTDRQRDVLLYYHDKELSIPQIARIMRLNKSTISRHLRAAERKIKKLEEIF